LNYLRRISTRRLLTLCALTLVVAIGATAVAVATSGDGPQPEPKPLAKAVHEALNAPEVPGISAEVEFTNNLIDGASFEGGDPILTGADGRLWASPADGGKLRLELQASPELGGGNDSQLLVEGRHFELYDGTANVVYRGTILEEKGEHAEEHAVPSVARIQKEIDRAGKHADLSGADPSSVAGRPAYTVSAAPSHDGGLLGDVELAWDAENGIPLRGAVYAAGSDSPVLELEATDVSFEAVDASVFEISPPDDAKVVDLAPEPAEQHGKPQETAGLDAVTAAVDFELTAPKSLAGLPRTGVRGIEVDGEQAALVTYGEGLGGIAVIQSATEPERPAEAAAEDEGEQLTLPKVVIGDIKGEELDTALGSALWFSRDGVDYVVVGSVPPAAVEAAARGL
jgi:outer membrane lipoprotein-sorting protein